MRHIESLTRSLLCVVLLLTIASQMNRPILASDSTHQNHADSSSGDQSQANGETKYVVRTVGKKRFIDVSYGSQPLFTVRDRTDADADETDDYDHDFHLSPDHKHLFIEQKTMHCFDVATLYGPTSASHYGVTLVHGRPFDEAAGRAFCKIMHLNNQYDNGTCVTHFIGWSKDGVDFGVGAANFYCGDGPQNAGEIEYDWTGHFDFKTQRFTRIHLDSTYTHAQWQREHDRQSN
jgi:hypothetical protein